MIKQVRIVHRMNHYVVEVVYEGKQKQYELVKNKIASIEIGLNNLTTFSCRRQPKLLIKTELNISW